jgi:hypothetical protein
MCAWVSTKPGRIVLPATSITLAPAGTSPRAPTLTMRLFRTTTSASSMISLSFIVMTRAPRSTTVPCGRSRATRTTTGNSFAAKRFLPSESSFALPAAVVSFSRIFFCASMARSKAKPESSSYLNSVLPSAHSMDLPSPLQVANSPPTSVRRRAGTVLFSGSWMETTGASPPTSGTVTMYTS